MSFNGRLNFNQEREKSNFFHQQPREISLNHHAKAFTQNHLVYKAD